jgi:acyl-CoA thioesterase
MKRFHDDLEVHNRFKRQIQEKFQQDTFAQLLGIKLVEIGPGMGVAELEVQPNMLNFHGSTHGGVVFTLADYVFAVACNSYGKTSVGLQVSIGYLAASFSGSKLRATAVEEKRNNRTAWYRITVESENEVIANLDALAYRKNDYFVPIEEME